MPSQDLAGEKVTVGTRLVPLMSLVTMIAGRDSAGKPVVPLFNSDGSAPSTSTTAVKTLVAATTNGSIPAGFISAQLLVGAGATVVIDGIPFSEGQSIYYAPASKLHPAVNYTVSGGTLYGYYEV